MMDFEAATRLSGARFVVVKGKLARLERALMQFMLDLHTDEHGYTEIDPPLLVRDEAMIGTAQLPKFRDDQFSVTAGRQIGNRQSDEPTAEDLLPTADFWLIPTAEVPLTNLVREQILDEAALPLRFTARHAVLSCRGRRRRATTRAACSASTSSRRSSSSRSPRRKNRSTSTSA